MIWAASTFYNELDVLEIRLATLDPYVDRFVLAEANVTQRGTPKPFHLDRLLPGGDQHDRFAPWLDKIRIVKVEDMPAEQDPDGGTLPHWDREHHQRNALERGMADLAEDDLVLVGDIDEIPYPWALEEALAGPPLRFPMDMHVYRLNWRWTQRPVEHGSASVVHRGEAFWDEWGQWRPVHLMLLGMPAPWRLDANGYQKSCGWHLAYMGSAEQIAAKTQAIADDAWTQLIPEAKKEQRPDRESWYSPVWAQECIDTGADVYGRDERQAEWVDLSELPPYVGEHADRFAHLLVGRP